MSLAETSPRVSPRVRGIDEITLANETNERLLSSRFYSEFSDYLVSRGAKGRRGEFTSSRDDISDIPDVKSDRSTLFRRHIFSPCALVSLSKLNFERWKTTSLSS